MKRRNTLIKKTGRIETFVAKEPVGGSRGLVRPRPSNSVDPPTGSSPVLGGIVCRQYGKLLNRIHSQCNAICATRRPTGMVNNAHPIEAVVIQLWPRAGNGHLSTVSASTSVRTWISKATGHLILQRVYTRLKSRQLSPISPVQRQLNNGVGVHQAADAGRGRFD